MFHQIIDELLLFDEILFLRFLLLQILYVSVLENKSKARNSKPLFSSQFPVSTCWDSAAPGLFPLSSRCTSLSRSPPAPHSPPANHIIWGPRSEVDSGDGLPVCDVSVSVLAPPRGGCTTSTSVSGGCWGPWWCRTSRPTLRACQRRPSSWGTPSHRPGPRSPWYTGTAPGQHRRCRQLWFPEHLTPQTHSLGFWSHLYTLLDYYWVSTYTSFLFLGGRLFCWLRF